MIGHIDCKQPINIYHDSSISTCTWHSTSIHAVFVQSQRSQICCVSCYTSFSQRTSSPWISGRCRCNLKDFCRKLALFLRPWSASYSRLRVARVLKGPVWALGAYILVFVRFCGTPLCCSGIHKSVSRYSPILHSSEGNTQ